MHEGVIGWDIGGANLKAAHLNGCGVLERVIQLPCPLWQGLSHLDRALEQALTRLPTSVARHAITMTGELVDLFANRAQGVQSLIQSLATHLPAVRMEVYAGEAGFVSPALGAAMAQQVASANWMATAAYVAPLVSQGIIVDVGSTTTDIIPVRGKILARGHDDHQRMVFDELVYTGVVRTSVVAVVKRVLFEGEWVTVMAEHFATMADVHRLTGELPADSDEWPTADNQGRSDIDCARRLARLIGRDAESAELQCWRRMAGHLAEQQQRRIMDACARTLSRGLLDEHAPLIGAGIGRFVVKQLAKRMKRPYIDFSSFVECRNGAGDWAAHCAPAVAVAALVNRRL